MTDVFPRQNCCDQNGLVTIFGGSGFIGRHIVQALAERGWRVRVACRRPDLAYFLQPLGNPGQVNAIQANIRYPRSIASAVRGADAVINLVGILSENGRQNFEAVQSFGSNAIASAAADAGIENFVQMSAIGASADSPAAYARTKAWGEQAVHEAIPSAVIMRPSIVFGPEDSFFNRFATLARMAPVLPLVGADTLFQPVYVGDVAKAFVKALGGQAKAGATYELGGPETASFRTLVEWVCEATERKRMIAALPFGAGRAMAMTTEILSKLSLGLFPEMLMTTRDQVAMLAVDNVVSPEATAAGLTLQGLGIEPESFRTIAPTYLWRYRASGQFDVKRLA